MGYHAQNRERDSLENGQFTKQASRPKSKAQCNSQTIANSLQSQNKSARVRVPGESRSRSFYRTRQLCERQPFQTLHLRTNSQSLEKTQLPKTLVKSTRNETNSRWRSKATYLGLWNSCFYITCLLLNEMLAHFGGTRKHVQTFATDTCSKSHMTVHTVTFEMTSQCSRHIQLFQWMCCLTSCDGLIISDCGADVHGLRIWHCTSILCWEKHRQEKLGEFEPNCLY